MLCAAYFVHAQTNAIHRNMLSNLLQPQTQLPEHVAMKTTSVPRERLIGQSLLDNTLMPHKLTDSVHLSYSDNRSSTYDFSMMFYAFNYPYGNTPMFSYSGLFTKPQVMYDTMLRWMIAPDTTVYAFFSQAIAKYDPLNDITSYKIAFTDSVTYQNSSYLNNYNAAGNIVKGYTFFMHAGMADSAYTQYYSYNSSNEVAEDSIYVYTGTGWRIIAKSYYTYDAGGNLITIDTYADSTVPLREKLKYVNTYDATKRLLTVQASYFDGTSLVPYVKDTFGYSGTLTYNTSWKEYQYDGINHYWAPYFYMTKQLNTLSLPDTIYIKGWDSVLNNWVPQTMETASYDTFKLPIRLMSYQYGGTTYPTLASTVTSYYYQRFNDNTSVTDIRTLHGVKVYPNPTSDNVNITIDQLQINTPIFILLYNTNGQLVRSLQTVWQQRAIQMPVADVNPGIYWLSIQDADGTLMQRQMLIKR